jgi:hypothetical protein
VGLPNEAPLEESEPQRGHVVRNKCPAPNRKRPSACLAETASTNQRGKAIRIGNCSCVETDCGLDEEDSNPSPVTSSAIIGSDPDQVVVQEEATPESGQMTATGTNQRGKATGSCSSAEKGGGGRDEEDSKSSLVTYGARIGSSPGQEVFQEQATTTHVEIPYGWTRVKLEPDC